MSNSASIVFEALKNLSNGRAKEGKGKSSDWYVIAILSLFIIALLLQIWSNFSDSKFVPYGVLFCLAMVYLMLLAFPFVVAWRNRVEIKRVFSNPLATLIDGVSREHEKGSKFINEVSKVDLIILKHVLIDVRAEKEAFEKRIGLVVGKIDRIGIVFGLLAFFVTMNQTMNSSKDASSLVSEWALAISFGVPVLYMFGLWGSILASKMGYMVDLLEFAVGKKESKGKVKRLLLKNM